MKNGLSRVGRGLCLSLVYHGQLSRPSSGVREEPMTWNEWISNKCFLILSHIIQGCDEMQNSPCTCWACVLCSPFPQHPVPRNSGIRARLENTKALKYLTGDVEIDLRLGACSTVGQRSQGHPGKAQSTLTGRQTLASYSQSVSCGISAGTARLSDFPRETRNWAF